MTRQVLVLVTLAIGLASGGWTSPAPDVVLYGPPSLDPLMHALATRFATEAHVPVHVFVAAPDAIAGLLQHHARADVVFGDAANLALLVRAGLVRAESVRPFGHDRFVLIAGRVISAQNPAPLLAASTIVLTDPTPAASFSGVSVLHATLPQLELTRSLGVADTASVIATVRQSAGLIGLVLRSEADGPGVHPVATLPGPGLAIDGGLVVQGQSAHAAALLDYIAGPAGRALRTQAGLESAS